MGYHFSAGIVYRLDGDGLNSRRRLHGNVCKSVGTGLVQEQHDKHGGAAG